ncbi:hypothetical protein [Leptospira idonii]|uniref:Uncharacterized protein n=1 Tax=Leptospira idonii TaxID=1193500 RepID=A0A4R9M2H9_9LEPT|nr:hypothetical protein [Leptospira idonii]TGN20181.1 hypothetical protein EHS15_05690 [Leptospira idonii]
MSIRLPLVLSLVFFSVNFLVCSFSYREKNDERFRLGDSIIRYAEELDKNSPSPSQSRLQHNNHIL